VWVLLRADPTKERQILFTRLRQGRRTVLKGKLAMLRFIVKRRTYQGMCRDSVFTSFETVDCQVPELEAVLLRGGWGGGPDNENFDQSELVNVEVRESGKEL
jgi:hypothetical protein